MILPIAWQDKINNPELVALFQQYSENQYLTAQEINLIRDTINSLISRDPSNFDMIDYRQKLEKQETEIHGTGEEVLQELLSASYRINTGITRISGIVFNLAFSYFGREFTIVNFQTAPITIVNNSPAEGKYHFSLVDDVDIVLRKNQMAKFKFAKRNGESVLELVSRNSSINNRSVAILGFQIINNNLVFSSNDADEVPLYINSNGNLIQTL